MVGWAGRATRVSDTRRLSRRLGLTRAALWWERLSPALLPAGCAAGLFLAVSFLGIWGLVGPLAHIGGLAAFALTLPAALLWGFRGFSAPSESEAVRRIERDGGLIHRPIETLSDKPAAKTYGTSAHLWRLHQDQAAEMAGRTKASVPHPNLPVHDPVALRIAVTLMLVVGLLSSWGESGSRLASAFSPDFSVALVRGEIAVDAWTTPPGYTGEAPVFLDRKDVVADVYTVPEYSVLKVRVDGASNTPRLASDRLSGEVPAEFTAIEGIPDAFQVEAELVTGQTLTVMDGNNELASWTFVITLDHAPTIEMPEPVGISRRLAVRILFEAADDYGVEKVIATVALDPESNDIGKQSPAPEEFELPVRGVSPKFAHGQAYRDLLSHPFAGLPVLITLTATDSAGQTGKSEPFRITLPERAFVNEVARALIEERRILTRTSGKSAMVSRTLDAILVYPHGLFDSLTPYLGIRVAAERLKAANSPEVLASVRDLLWQVAVRLEDGKLSDAMADLRAAQKALQEALERGASDAEIQALMENLRNAMDQYLAELARRAMESAENGDEQMERMSDDANELSRNQLQEMLNAIEDMARTGTRDAAQEMLSQLENVLENLEMGMQQNDGQMGQQEQAMNEALSELSDMIAEQQRLMDQTLRESQGMQQGQQGRQDQQGRRGQQQGQQGQNGQGRRGQMGEMSRPGQNDRPGENGQMQPGQGTQPGQNGQQGLARGQRSLREKLGDVMGRLREMGPEIPGALGRAERAMRDAERSLGEGEAGGALPLQRGAIDQLRSGAQALARELMERMQHSAEGEGQGETGQTGGRDTAGNQEDPLGRPRGQRGQDFGDRVKIPDERTLESAREIVRELRRRSGELQRPVDELDYLKRLLERF